MRSQGRMPAHSHGALFLLVAIAVLATLVMLGLATPFRSSDSFVPVPAPAPAFSGFR